jgi:predicted site-specific integrase-resolvase
MFVPLRVAAKHYNVSKQTISAWASKGDLEFTILPGGHRRFKIKGDGNVDVKETPRKEKVDVCYCRVSSGGQKEDLKRQIAYMQRKYPGWEIVSDVGSGLNWKRNGLKTLLRRCMQGDIRQVAVAHKDRLARFGYQIIEYMLGECGVKLLCDDSEIHVSKERELVDDILSIVTVFSARIHGQRHYKNQDHQEDQEADPGPSKRRRTETEGVDGVLQENI